MGPADYVMMYWKNYAEFNGRSRRAEYWWPVLANFVVGFVLAIFALIPLIGLLFGVVLVGFGLASIVPAIAVGVRRMHDIGKSGAYILFAFVPFVGGIIVLVLTATDSQPGTNQWGTSVKYPQGPGWSNRGVDYDAVGYGSRGGPVQHGQWSAAASGQPYPQHQPGQQNQPYQPNQYYQPGQPTQVNPPYQPPVAQPAAQPGWTSDLQAQRHLHDQWLAQKQGQPWSPDDYAYQRRYEEWERQALRFQNQNRSPTSAPTDPTGTQPPAGV
jgi:uncharacterized membrane protein YhaH (DUF805 family)